MPLPLLNISIASVVVGILMIHINIAYERSTDPSFQFGLEDMGANYLGWFLGAAFFFLVNYVFDFFPPYVLVYIVYCYVIWHITYIAGGIAVILLQKYKSWRR
jgi:hypothetical protein